MLVHPVVRSIGEAAIVLGVLIVGYSLLTTRLIEADRAFAYYAAGVMAHLSTLIYVLVRTHTGGRLRSLTEGDVRMDFED